MKNYDCHSEIIYYADNADSQYSDELVLLPIYHQSILHFRRKKIHFSKKKETISIIFTSATDDIMIYCVEYNVNYVKIFKIYNFILENLPEAFRLRQLHPRRPFPRLFRV